MQDLEPALLRTLRQAFSAYKVGKLAEAEKLCEQILAERHDIFDVFHLLALVQSMSGKNAVALANYDRALRLRPASSELHNNRGIALDKLGRFEEALASYDRALALRPDNSQAHNNRGAVLLELRRVEEALGSFERAIALHGHYAEAHHNCGRTLHDLRRFPEALARFDRAIALRPDYAEAHNHRGVTLGKLGRFQEALGSFDRVLALRPDNPEALANRGNVLKELKRFEEALANFDRAFAARPGFREVLFNAGVCRLLTGDFDRGWENYEWRIEVDQAKFEKRNLVTPRWRGESDIAGKTMLLYADQGFGDTIQFCRYAPLIAQLGARVVLEVQKSLHQLTSTLNAVQIVSRGDPLPAFDMHSSLLSLPLAFKTRLETIPAKVPYLRASPQVSRSWSARLEAKRRPWIGLAWSGSPTHRNDQNRSIKLECLLSLLKTDATFVSLQKDVREQDTGLLKKQTALLHFEGELENFADTAGLISNLDLVISVDTSVAHLAGALAKPVWVLLPFIPDWRWLLDRDDSPWYPTARLFRQDHTRRWDSVIPRVGRALHDLVESW
jgi:tetratricopeptide (TPR) repeat protein